MGTIFVAGIYGVGKSTLCQEMATKLQVPCFSAGDLISNVNGEKYGANKAVSDKNMNQNILIIEVQKILKAHPRIILAGHFCIFTKQNTIDILPRDVFRNLNIERILLLEADIDVVLRHLSLRDQRKYTYSEIRALGEAERKEAISVAADLNCEMTIHKMNFDNKDLLRCIKKLRKEDET